MDETVEHIRRAIEALSPRELYELMLYARLRAFGFQRRAVSATAEDLLQETLVKIMSGERKWNPARAPFAMFFRGCMRSIAFDWKKHAQIISVEDLTAWETGQGETDNAAVNVSADVDIEEELRAKRELERIRSLFVQDEIASKVISRWFEGHRRRDVIKELQISDHEYAAAVKRISRRVKQAVLEEGVHGR